MKILGLAAVLFVVSLIAFFQAINLIPTDLGFTWMTGGFITFAASAVVLAIGFASSALIKAQRMGTMLSTIAGAATAERPRMAPSMEPPASDPPLNEAPKSGKLGTAAMIGAGAAVAGAAGMFASKADAKTDPPSSDTPALDTPALDTPVLDAPNFDVPAPTTAHSDETLVFDLPPLPKITLDEPVVEVEAPKSAPTKDTILEDFERDLFAEFPALRKDPPIEGLSVAEPVADPAPGVEQEISTDAEEPAATSVETLAPVTAVEVAEDEAPAPQPGLIADADLAALEDAEPALAPIETLDVVGAYDSGGTRFTMYSDGSVTAIGPTMDQRFASLDALRAYLDSAPKA